MAVRDFKDGRGRQWRAWDVTPDELNPRTKDEDYLAQLYHTGWIVFETKDENEKRRLYPVPKDWHLLPDPELEVLLHKAEVVPQRKLKTERRATGEAAVEAIRRAEEFTKRAVEAPELVRDVPLEETPDVTDLSAVRSFRYPGGRIWMVCVVKRPGRAEAPVLRFTAGDRHFDLVDWPKDWIDYPNAELVKLLHRAAPRTATAPPTRDTPRRRWDDQRAS